MLKTGFVSAAMCAALGQAVNTRELGDNQVRDFINEGRLAQTSALVD